MRGILTIIGIVLVVAIGIRVFKANSPAPKAELSMAGTENIITETIITENIITWDDI